MNFHFGDVIKIESTNHTNSAYYLLKWSREYIALVDISSNSEQSLYFETWSALRKFLNGWGNWTNLGEVDSKIRKLEKIFEAERSCASCRGGNTMFHEKDFRAVYEGYGTLKFETGSQTIEKPINYCFMCGRPLSKVRKY